MYPVVNGFYDADVVVILWFCGGQNVTGVLRNQGIASCHYAEQPALMQDDDGDNDYDWRWQWWWRWYGSGSKDKDKTDDDDSDNGTFFEMCYKLIRIDSVKKEEINIYEATILA